MNGYAGSILRIDLTNSSISSIPTSDYAEDWVGGHGMGSAIFFDLVEDKTIDGFHPDNVVTMMTSPFCGTLVPGAGGRTEVQGIGVQSYPIGWFTRSNFGGRFSSMLKYAGWDGIILQGKADEPVWIDIRNDNVTIRNCSDLSLWGMKTQDCQKAIWGFITGSSDYGGWIEPNGSSGGRSTHLPAVVCIGPAGENRSRMGCLMHDRGNGSGQGGFGGVWGSKNLKAVSVIGTGGVHVYDPAALVRNRLNQKKNYHFRLRDLRIGPSTTQQSSPGQSDWPSGYSDEDKRPQACVGCHAGCRSRHKSGLGNEGVCYNSLVYYAGKNITIQKQATDLINDYGVNASELLHGLIYLKNLYDSNLIKSLGCPLDFNRWGEIDFFEHVVRMISYGDDGYGNPNSFGEALVNGFVRAAEQWGRLEGSYGDLKTGRLPFPHWGIHVHRDPRAQLEWGYGTILGDRDINEHDFDAWLHWFPTSNADGTSPFTTAEEAVRIHTDKMTPFQGDMQMLDFSTDNMYSEHIAKLVAWHRHYTRFWKQSTLLCDWRWPDFMNVYQSGLNGSTGEAEPEFLKAVTGKNLTFLDGMELGKKIWNLDQAIWILQGRHRNQVLFADYVYDTDYADTDHYLPGIIDGEWTYFNAINRRIDRNKFEEFKTRFYDLEGWGIITSTPTRSTLEGLGLGYVADELEIKGKYNTPPLITLIGSATVEVTQGDAYADAGATALDEKDGNLTAGIVVDGDEVDTDTLGRYTITYNVTDSDGNAAQEVSRTVIVINTPPEAGSSGSGGCFISTMLED